jgi:hypothetical protein
MLLAVKQFPVTATGTDPHNTKLKGHRLNVAPGQIALGIESNNFITWRQ